MIANMRVKEYMLLGIVVDYKYACFYLDPIPSSPHTRTQRVVMVLMFTSLTRELR